MRLLLCCLLILVSSLVSITIAKEVEATPENCRDYWKIGNWGDAYYGPIILCKGGFVDFQWRGGPHGVFQIPELYCPTDFQGQKTDDYQFLAPASFGGSYRWTLPNATGEYIATSPQGLDCANGTFPPLLKLGDVFRKRDDLCTLMFFLPPFP